MYKAQAIIQKLESYGYPPDFLRQVGAIILLWSMIEQNLEWTILALRNEEPRGRRPSTDSKNASQLISELAHEGTVLKCKDDRLGALTILLSEIAGDLLEYRNTLAHGHASALAPGTIMMSRNWAMLGEEKKRPYHATLATTQILLLAIETAAILHDTLKGLHRAVGPYGASDREKCLGLLRDVKRARSQASELRHIVSIGDHEKY